MPLQNRVDPFGELHANPARGSLMGNRGGRIHRPDQSLGPRRWTSKRWIACVCEFRGRRRSIWGDSYTELFFLDEVTALAAGHRPCFECRRVDALSFSAAFGDGAAMKADYMDAILHAERLDGGAKRLPEAAFDELPDGAMTVLDGRVMAVHSDALLPWSFSGYGPPRKRPGIGRVLLVTPPAIVRALRAGYAPRWAPH